MPVLTEPIPHVHAWFLAAPGSGITAPFWAGFVVAVIVPASTWRVFDRAAVAQAYAEPD